MKKLLMLCTLCALSFELSVNAAAPAPTRYVKPATSQSSGLDIAGADLQLKLNREYDVYLRRLNAAKAKIRNKLEALEEKTRSRGVSTSKLARAANEFGKLFGIEGI